MNVSSLRMMMKMGRLIRVYYKVFIVFFKYITSQYHLMVSDDAGVITYRTNLEGGKLSLRVSVEFYYTRDFLFL